MTRRRRQVRVSNSVEFAIEPHYVVAIETHYVHACCKCVVTLIDKRGNGAEPAAEEEGDGGEGNEEGVPVDWAAKVAKLEKKVRICRINPPAC